MKRRGPSAAPQSTWVGAIASGFAGFVVVVPAVALTLSRAFAASPDTAMALGFVTGFPAAAVAFFLGLRFFGRHDED